MNTKSSRQISIENAVQIRSLNARMLIQEKSTKDLHHDVRKVLNHINSDSETNSEGSIEQGHRHDREIKLLFGHYKEFKTVSATVATIISVIVGFLTWLISK